MPSNDEIVDTRLAASRQIATLPEGVMETILLAKSHADWLVGFLSVPGPISGTFLERAFQQSQKLVDCLAAALPERQEEK